MTLKGQSIQLIVGLGNPGAEYADTRHNAGAWLVESLCQQYRLSLKVEPKFHARVTQWSFSGKEFKIFLPNTYMNHSGSAVGAIAKYYQIPAETIIIAHDELDLPPGDFQFKIGGGHAGHNGLKDIIHHLGTREFQRIRIGIGHPGHKDDVSNYVLTKPSKEDKQKIKMVIQEAITKLQELINRSSTESHKKAEY